MKPPEVAVADRRVPAGTDIYVDDWLFVKPIRLAKDEVCQQHVHEHDHVTLVARGVVRLWIDGEDRGLYSSPECVKIHAGESHRFFAEMDALLYCIHNLRGEGYPAIARMEG